jgi:hypothetical protein
MGCGCGIGVEKIGDGWELLASRWRGRNFWRGRRVWELDTCGIAFRDTLAVEFMK